MSILMQWLKNILRREPKDSEHLGYVHNEDHDTDPRNLAYDDIVVFGAPIIPKDGFISARKHRVLNQGRTSSCTMHSTFGCTHQTSGAEISPRHGYWKIKTDSKYPSSKIGYGAYLKDSVAVLVNEGVCDYDLAPNEGYVGKEDAYLRLQETPEMRESAKDNKGGSYVYVTRSRGSQAIFDATVRYMFEQKRPVKIGMKWYREYNKARNGGVVPAKFPDSSWSGHDMCAVAWREDYNGEPYLGLINSWGPYWGDNGMIWIPRNYSHLYTGIAYVPPDKETELKIDKEIKAEIKITERNIHKERAIAYDLRRFIDEVWFENIGTEEQRTANAVARGIAGRRWYVIVKAVTYFGWKYSDVKNYLYAHSRGKTETKAYELDFSIKRSDYFKK